MNLLTRHLTHTTEFAVNVSSHRLQLKGKKGIQDAVTLMDDDNLHYNEQTLYFI